MSKNNLRETTAEEEAPAESVAASEAKDYVLLPIILDKLDVEGRDDLAKYMLR